jgi:hypothetical protein
MLCDANEGHDLEIGDRRVVERERGRRRGIGTAALADPREHLDFRGLVARFTHIGAPGEAEYVTGVDLVFFVLVVPVLRLRCRRPLAREARIARLPKEQEQHGCGTDRLCRHGAAADFRLQARAKMPIASHGDCVLPDESRMREAIATPCDCKARSAILVVCGFAAADMAPCWNGESLAGPHRIDGRTGGHV